jgi:hypothetical protein
MAAENLLTGGAYNIIDKLGSGGYVSSEETPYSEV